MSAEISTSNAAGIICGACSATNQAEAQFCRQCGHALYEVCVACNKPVLLSQAFCGNCGENLQAALEKKRAKFTESIGKSVSLAKESRFDEAIGTLERLTGNKDYRFRDLTEQATQALEKIQSVSQKMESNVDQAIEEAKHAIQSEDHDAVVRLLGNVPQVLLTEDVWEAVSRSRAIVERRDALRAECETAIKSKDYELLGPILEQLIQLDPTNGTYPKLSIKVTEKLFARAKKLFDKRKYAKSLSVLDSIPKDSQGKECQELRESIENIQWLKAQFVNEPFDTPVLGRLAVRLAKDEPDDPGNQSRIATISKNLKTGKRSPLNGYPYRSTPNYTWAGGKFEFFRMSQKLSLGELSQLAPWSGRLNEAMGLALQGVGLAKVDYNLMPQKGFLKSLRKRKDKIAWGMDIGATAIKAICLQRTEEGVEVIDGFVHEFDEPLCRPSSETHRDSIITDAIETVLEKYSIGETPAWVNLGAQDVISRFSLLPPVADKQAKELVEREKQQRIPMDLNLLEVRNWLGSFDDDNQRGRASTTIAVKKTVVESSIELLREAGLNVVGVQADQIAMVNLIYHEFEDILNVEVDEDDDLDAIDDDDDENKKGLPTIAMLHCGAQTMTAFLVSSEGHWFWTIEQGGEDLTKLLARQLKVTMTEAEELKRNPHTLTSPASDYPALENRLDEWKARVQKLFADGAKLDPDFDVMACYTSGGGCYTHQFLKRMLLQH